MVLDEMEETNDAEEEEKTTDAWPKQVKDTEDAEDDEQIKDAEKKEKTKDGDNE